MTTYADSSDILTGGSWVNDRGVRRWVPNPPPLAPAPVVACPTCGALKHETCRNTSGKVRTPHTGRDGVPMCRCGASKEPRKTYCEDCRVLSQRQTWAKQRWRKAGMSARAIELEREAS